MKTKKGKWLVALVVVAMLFAMVSAVGANDNCFEPPAGAMGVTLYAGQTIDVGMVYVWNDSENLYVQYMLDDDAWDSGDGWGIYETHVHVGETLKDFPLNRPGNPQIGLFGYKATHEGVQCYTETIPLGDWEADDLLVAAHAVIEKIDCEVLAEAPYGGSEVVDTFQAWRIDHTPEAPRYVRAQRSIPNNALEIGVPGQETFYSLGYGGALNDERTAVESFFGEYFEDRRDPDGIKEMEALVDADLSAKLSDTEKNAGWIIIEFDPPALNVEGEYDLQVVEDTWGLPYPLELAAVFGRADASNDWTFLFLAHNQQPEGNGVWTITEGALGDLDEVTQILIQDVSDPQWFIPYPHSVATLDGYDLNAIVALNDHKECEKFNETAWAAGTRFTEQGNWATYFLYTLQEYLELVDEFTVDSAYPHGTDSSIALIDGEDYRIKVSGTWSNKPSNPHMVDAKYISFDDWENHLEGYPERDTTLLELMVDGEFVDWGEFNPDHIYYWNIEGKGGTVNIRVNDTYYGDNVGIFDVEIYRVW